VQTGNKPGLVLRNVQEEVYNIFDIRGNTDNKHAKWGYDGMVTMIPNLAISSPVNGHLNKRSSWPSRQTL
jgi:hypothetical protein